MQMKSEDMLGYAVCRESVARCVDSIFAWLQQGDSCRWLACINPHSYVVSLSNPGFSSALQEADWLIPDGSGVVLASRLLKGKIRNRITGSDIFTELHERMNQMGGMSVFFMGATEETLSDIRKRMAQDYPNIRVAGTFSPPFKPEYSRDDVDAMVLAVNRAHADVLWVGLTSPKQDLWIHQNRRRLNVRFAAGVGAVFDFYTGRVKRSHPVFQRLGLEWLPRLLQEPRRLWRRMGVSAPIFIWHVLKAKMVR